MSRRRQELYDKVAWSHRNFPEASPSGPTSPTSPIRGRNGEWDALRGQSAPCRQQGASHSAPLSPPLSPKPPTHRDRRFASNMSRDLIPSSTRSSVLTPKRPVGLTVRPVTCPSPGPIKFPLVAPPGSAPSRSYLHLSPTHTTNTKEAFQAAEGGLANGNSTHSVRGQTASLDRLPSMGRGAGHQAWRCQAGGQAPETSLRSTKPLIIGWEKDQHQNTLSQLMRLGAHTSTPEIEVLPSSRSVSYEVEAKALQADASADAVGSPGEGQGAQPDSSRQPGTPEQMAPPETSRSKSSNPDNRRRLLRQNTATAQEKLAQVQETTRVRVNFYLAQRSQLAEQIQKLRAAPTGVRAKHTANKLKLDLNRALEAVSEREAQEIRDMMEAEAAAARAAALAERTARKAAGLSTMESDRHEESERSTGLDDDDEFRNSVNFSGKEEPGTMGPAIDIPRDPLDPFSAGQLGILRSASNAISMSPRALAGMKSAGKYRTLARLIKSRHASFKSGGSSFKEPRMPELPAEPMAPLLLLEPSMFPDKEEDEEHDANLVALKDDHQEPPDAQPSTYSRLFKPALNSAVNPFQLGPQSDWDPAATLDWANRGIGEAKMKVLKDTLLQNSFLTGLQLSGNNLSNACVAEILSILSQEEAPPIAQLDLSANTGLTWRCMYAIATSLGAKLHPTPGEGDDAEMAAVSTLPPELPVAPMHMLTLRRLMLSGTKLTDRGAILLAEAIRSNRILKELNVSRCSISDPGGTALLDALSDDCTLVSIDISWNALREGSAKALHGALISNGCTQVLRLDHNGFSDLDCARILSGLSENGVWRYVDLSYNNLGAGSALVISDMVDKFSKIVSTNIEWGKYAKSWDLEAWPAGKIDTSEWYEHLPSHADIASGTSPPPPKKQLGSISRGPQDLGKQVDRGPILLNIAGNPLGFAGLRQLLHCLDWMSTSIEDSALAYAARTGQKTTFAGIEGEEDVVLLPPWPLALNIERCNINITDNPPPEDDVPDAGEKGKKGKKGKGKGKAAHAQNNPYRDSPNPFIPSLHAIVGDDWGRSDKDKLKAKEKAPPPKKAGKNDEPVEEDVNEFSLNAQSQSLDLTSPSGKYRMDLGNPGSHLIVRHLVDIKAQLESAVKNGLFKNVALSIKDVLVNGRPSNVDKVLNMKYVTEGMVSMNVVTPSVLLAAQPSSMSDQSIDWMVASLQNKSASEIWKISVLQVACSRFYFTWEQILELVDVFDPEMSATERIAAAEMLYARCTNPLLFWSQGLPLMPPQQQIAVKSTLGDCGALNIQNPAGRYMLNLSRSLDRYVAMRLQEASGLERSWETSSKYFINWRNARLNGAPLSMEGLTRIRDYTIPTKGSLRFDYVTYTIPPRDAEEARADMVGWFFTELRKIRRTYHHEIQELRNENLPFGQLRSQLPPPKKLKGRVVAAKEPEHHGEGRRIMNMRLVHLVRSDSPTRAKKADKLVKVADMTKQLEEQSAQEAQAEVAVAEAVSEAIKSTADANGEASSSGRPLSGVPQQPVLADGEAPSSLGSLWWQNLGFAGAAVLKKAAAAAKAKAAAIATAKAAGGGVIATAAAIAAVKAGKDAKGGSARPGKPPPVLAREHPQERTELHMSPQNLERAEELAVMLLQIPSIKEVSQVLAKFAPRHMARVLHAFIRLDPKSGAKAAAALVECLTPVHAVIYVFDMYDTVLPLLTNEVRSAILSALNPKVSRQLASVQADVNASAIRRARQVRVLLQTFGADTYLSCEQLRQMLKSLRFGQDRITAMVALWSRIVDRDSIFDTFLKLHESERQQVIKRLGHWHCWTTLGRPYGLTFYFDLTEPEQKEIAKEVVKLAVKATAQAKIANKNKGLTQVVQHLNGLMGNGFAMSVPEDDKLWNMIESSYNSLEFTFKRSAEQEVDRLASSALSIQRIWRFIARARQAINTLHKKSAEAGYLNLGIPRPMSFPQIEGDMEQLTAQAPEKSARELSAPELTLQP